MSIRRTPIAAIVFSAVILASSGANALPRYRFDCESADAWFFHVRNAATRFLGTSLDLGFFLDLKAKIDQGELSFNRIGASLNVLGQTIQAHLSPLGAVEFVGAIACIVRADELYPPTAPTESQASAEAYHFVIRAHDTH